MSGAADDLPRGAEELTHELVEVVAGHSHLDVRAIVGALLSIAYVIACDAYRGDKAKAIQTLDRHVDYMAGRPIRGATH